MSCPGVNNDFLVFTIIKNLCVDVKNVIDIFPTRGHKIQNMVMQL